MGLLRRLLGGSQSREAVQKVAAWIFEPERSEAALDIVGEASYQDALNALAGGRDRDGPIRREHIAVLVPEPNNRYDRNAVSVQIETRHVGYLSRENAIAYQPVIQWALARGKYLAAHAYLTGGWDRGPHDRGLIGVVLHMGSPAECIIELLMDGATVRQDHRWPGALIAFTGDSTCRMSGFALDCAASIALAQRAGLVVHPRVTKKVQLLVDCDRSGASANEARAREYGIPVIDKLEFWTELGVEVERLDWRGAQ